MKTIREYIDLIESAQTPVAEDWIDDDAAEPLAKYFADLYYGDFSVTMKIKLTSHIYQAIQNGELSIEQLKADIDMLEKEKGIKEAISKTDLLKQVSAELNDPEFRKQPADPTKSFTKGDHWQGAKPGDYGYTGYQGHGMPTDRAEQARIRADKKKGLPEDEATAKMGLMSAMGSNDNNPADQRRAMAQQAVERLATKR